MKQVAVLGAGTMGTGIAHVAALGGYRTALYDVSPDAVERAVRTIRERLDKGVSLGKVTPEARDAAIARLRGSTELEASLAPADLVIETAPENMELKRRLFATADAVCAAHAVIASNTSSMSITEMAAATKRPRQVVGMHFFNPGGPLACGPRKRRPGLERERHADSGGKPTQLPDRLLPESADPRHLILPWTPFGEAYQGRVGLRHASRGSRSGSPRGSTPSASTRSRCTSSG